MNPVYYRSRTSVTHGSSPYTSTQPDAMHFVVYVVSEARVGSMRSVNMSARYAKP